MLRIAVAVVALGACASDEPRPPIARADVRPAYVPLGDDYHTDVVLDGTGSSDPFTGDGGALRFAWSVADPKLGVTAGALDAATVTVRVAGMRPTDVALVVTGAAGASATVHAEIGVTLPVDAGQ